MQNIEVKVRCHDLDAARAAVDRIGAHRSGLLRQTDTFFCVPDGRLKLRRCEGQPPVLIGYQRDDRPGARRSTYQMLELTDKQADALEEVLSLVTRPWAIVTKKRQLHLWQNVRIHLDRVDGLGDFVELEIVGEADEARGGELAGRLLRELGLRDEDRVAVAYADLIAEEAKA
jgi:adenylate cyclase class IV